MNGYNTLTILGIKKNYFPSLAIRTGTKYNSFFLVSFRLRNFSFRILYLPISNTNVHEYFSVNRLFLYKEVIKRVMIRNNIIFWTVTRIVISHGNSGQNLRVTTFIIASLSFLCLGVLNFLSVAEFLFLVSI